MGKGVVSFDKTVGTFFTKKRKRLPGTDSNSQPEIKQYNMIYQVSSQADLIRGYDSMNMFPIPGINSALNDPTRVGSWKMWKLNFPGQGVDIHQRIGNAIFLQNIRIKGYLKVANNSPQQIRWRLKLYRFDQVAVQLGSGAPAQFNNYCSLYKNAETASNNTTAENYHQISVHNYYKMIKKLPKPYEWSSKVIASGVIPPSSENLVGQFGYGTAGSTASYTVGRNLHLSNNDARGFIPIDVLVKCNDRISWKREEGTNIESVNVSYGIALEEDCGAGILVSAGSASSSAITLPGWTYTQDTNDAPFYLSFFVRGYFTDD